jgi:hypothetical protein
MHACNHQPIEISRKIHLLMYISAKIIRTRIKANGRANTIVMVAGLAVVIPSGVSQVRRSLKQKATNATSVQTME